MEESEVVPSIYNATEYDVDEWGGDSSPELDPLKSASQTPATDSRSARCPVSPPHVTPEQTIWPTMKDLDRRPVDGEKVSKSR